MAFSLSGSVITQSGTDTSLAGLSGIAGVTTFSIGSGIGISQPRTFYNIGSLSLNVSGTLSYNANGETLCLGTRSTDGNGIRLFSGSSFTVTASYSSNGQNSPTQAPAIISSRQPVGAWFDVPNFLIQGNAGSVLTLTGVSISFLTNIFLSGTGSITDCLFVGLNNDQPLVQIFNAGMSLSRVVLIGTHGIVPSTPIEFTGVTVKSANKTSQFNGTGWFAPGDTTGLATFRDYTAPGGTQFDFQYWWNGPYAVIASATGSALSCRSNSINAIGNGFTLVYCPIRFLIRTLTGIPSDAKVYLKDKNNGSRRSVQSIGFTNASLTAQVPHLTQDQVYLWNVNSSTGLTSTQNVLIAAHTNNSIADNNTTGSWDYRGNTNDTNDLFTAYAYSYLELIQSISNFSAKGLGTKTIEGAVFADSSIVQSNPAIVAAYTGYSLNTSTNTLTITDASLNGARVYDWLKLWKVNNFALEYPTVSSLVAVKNEPILNLGNLNVVVDGVTWASHSSVTAITTTGTIGFINGADYNVTVTDSTGTRYPAVTISGFPTANNSNGIAPTPRVAITNLRTSTTQAYTVSGATIAIKLSDVGALPTDDVLVTADAIGYVRPLDQTVKGNRTEPLSFTFEPWLNARGQEIVGLESAASIDFDMIEERLELPTGSISFYAALMQWETVTAGGSFYLFPTDAVRRFDFAEGFDGTKRVVIADPWTIAAKPGAASSPIISDFTVISQTVTRDPFDHGLPSTAPGLTDRPEVVIAFQSPPSQVTVAAMGANVITADSLASSAIEEIRDASRVPSIQ